MGINIGMVIWKEMKAKSLSRDQLAEAAGVSKHRMGTILKSASIDTEILSRISRALEINFFDYYRTDSELAKFEIDPSIENNLELKELKNLVHEKNRLLELYEETIKSQKKIIASLEKLRK